MGREVHGLSQQLLLAEQPCLGQSTGTVVRLSGSESPRPTYQGVTSGFKAQGLSVLISKMGGVLIPSSHKMLTVAIRIYQVLGKVQLE